MAVLLLSPLKKEERVRRKNATIPTFSEDKINYKIFKQIRCKIYNI
ncbi:hypothetical protein [Saccharolobus solfataricus]|nr:hypothetical protein [Saccharolobus solfataricus]